MAAPGSSRPRAFHMCVWSILPMGQRSKRDTALTTDLISLPQATSCTRGVGWAGCVGVSGGGAGMVNKRACTSSPWAVLFQPQLH